MAGHHLVNVHLLSQGRHKTSSHHKNEGHISQYESQIQGEGGTNLREEASYLSTCRAPVQTFLVSPTRLWPVVPDTAAVVVTSPCGL